MNNQNQQGRSSEKREKISEYIRNHFFIIQLNLVTLIPNRTELKQQFETTPINFQRDVQPLIHDGQLFIKSIKRAFSYEIPPHLRRIASVFPYDFNYPVSENRFLRNLITTASDPKINEQLDIECFFGIDGRQNQIDHLVLLR